MAQRPMPTKKNVGAENADVNQLQKKWGVPIDPEILILALTHRSFANEMGGLPNNERLEFLGDSVLSIVVTEELYRTCPEAAESDLAKLRSAIVSQRPLARVARGLDLGSYILLGVGENKTGGRDKDSILSDTFEAMIGATYLSNGLEPTRSVLLHHLRDVIDGAAEPESVMDWKTPLREFALANRMGDVSFDVRDEGPDHNKHFYATVLAGQQPLATGDGPSRKDAENLAAKNAYLAMNDGRTPSR